MPLYKQDIAWLAGIIDGEGSITFIPTRKTGRHLCRLGITNTDEGILNEVKRIFGEWLIFYTCGIIPLGKLGRKTCYRIEVNRQAEIYFILAQVKPFLKSVKKEKIKLILDYMNEKDILGRNKNRRKKVLQFGLVFE